MCSQLGLHEWSSLAPTCALNCLFLQARVAKIVFGLGTYFGCLAVDRLTGSEDNLEKVRQRAQQLRETLTDLGPSFIKAGQVLANRPDIVREDYMNELCTLQVCWFWVGSTMHGTYSSLYDGRHALQTRQEYI